MFRRGFWKKKHYLNKMTLRELVIAFFQYYAIQAYIVVGLAGIWLAVTNATALLPNLLAVGAAILIYPLVWFLLHRYVLHGRIFYKSRLTARVWKRIHYDHHRDPHDLEILFGALYTTMPTIILATAPIGWLLDGLAGAASAGAAGMFITCFYEFCHCFEHLTYKPKSKWLKNMKTRHMAHHFHDEDGNFGITNFMWDRIFGTLYTRKDRPTKSATVFNLGYTESEAEKYPWIAEYSGGVDEDHTPRDRRRQAS